MKFSSLGKMPSVFCVCVCTRAVFDVDLIASRCVRGFRLLSCYTGHYSLEVFSFSHHGEDSQVIRVGTLSGNLIKSLKKIQQCVPNV